jgi:hypothetical protein
MSSPFQRTQIQVLLKTYNAGMLSAVFYSTSPDSAIYALDIDKEMLQEFEYPAEEAGYAYDEDLGCKRPYTEFLTPDDLSEKEMITLITANHHEDCELYTRQEWEAKHQHNVGLENLPAIVGYPVSIKVEIKNNRDMWGDLIDKQTITAWATYDKSEKPCLQIKRIMVGEIDIYPILTQALACFKVADDLFYEIEKRVAYEHEYPNS